MRKRVFALMMCAVLCLSGCGMGDGNGEYRRAVRELKNTEVAEDGTYAVTEELIIASQNAEYVEPKNIIYMIGDGMGYNIITHIVFYLYLFLLYVILGCIRRWLYGNNG